MAVISANLKKRRSFEWTADNLRSHIDQWIVICDSVTPLVNIVTSGYIPSLYSIHPDDPFAYCVAVRPSARDDTRTVIDVDIEYSNQIPQANQKPDNPLLYPVVRSYRTNPISRPVFKDINGNWVVNSAKQPYQPAYEKVFHNPVYIFKKNYPVFTDTEADTYTGHVNSTTFLGKAAKYIKCNDIQAEEQFENGYNFWAVTLEFEYDPFGWTVDLLNQGYNQLVSGKLIACKDQYFERVSEPVPLSSAGVQLTPAQIPDDLSYSTFEFYYTADFNDLGLTT